MKFYVELGVSVVETVNDGQFVGNCTSSISQSGMVAIEINDNRFPLLHFSEVFQADGITPIGADLATAQDYLIANTVFKTASGGSGASVNPTSGVIPINDNGTFVDSNIQQGSLYGMPTYEFNGLAKVSAVISGNNFLNLDAMNVNYSIGEASFSGGIPSANIGIAMASNRMVMGLQFAGGTEGMFRANGATGIVSIGGFGAEYTLGVNPFSGGILVGSSYITGTAPVNTTTPVRWVTIVSEIGAQYKIPVYQ